MHLSSLVFRAEKSMCSLINRILLWAGDTIHKYFTNLLEIVPLYFCQNHWIQSDCLYFYALFCGQMFHSNCWYISHFLHLIYFEQQWWRMRSLWWREVRMRCQRKRRILIHIGIKEMQTVWTNNSKASCSS